MPVRVLCEDLVCAEELVVVVLEDVLRVAGIARPVHEPGRLESGAVKIFEPDALRHLSHDRLVLFRIHITIQRNDEAEPRLFGFVLVGGIDRPGVGSLELHLLHEVIRSEVQVEGQDAPELYRVRLSSPRFKCSTDEAADVLDLILLGLGHL